MSNDGDATNHKIQKLFFRVLPLANIGWEYPNLVHTKHYSEALQLLGYSFESLTPLTSYLLQRAPEKPLSQRYNCCLINEAIDIHQTYLYFR